MINNSPLCDGAAMGLALGLGALLVTVLWFLVLIVLPCG